MLHVSERKEIYALLAALFSYPDPALLETFDRGEAGRVAALLPACPAPPQVAGGERLEELQAAFTELFINRLGGAAAPPYGSVYLEEAGRLMGTSTLLVAEAYRGEGLAVDGSPEPPDYLATEMEFLYFLVDREAEALRRKDVEASREALRKQADFCRALLHPWVTEFCLRLGAEEGAHPLYRWAGELLELFCQAESEWLENLA